MTPLEAHRAHVSTLRDGVFAAYASLEIGPRAAIFDAPIHDNVGDGLIWLGQREALSRTGTSVIYASDPITFRESDIARLPADCAILVNGGGNLGDLWPEHHELRLKVLRASAGRRVIQLPQTANFRSDDTLSLAQDVFTEHPDFHIMCRDRRTLELALQINRGRASLCADSAFALSPALLATGGRTRILCRTDAEGDVGERPDSAVDWVGVDTDSALDRRFRRAVHWYFRTAPRPGRPGLPNRLLVKQVDWMANLRLRYGLDLFKDSDSAIVDRLHAHILLMLLEVPHVVIDSGYGKISTFMDEWTAKSPLVARAENLDAAEKALAGLNSKPRPA